MSGETVAEGLSVAEMFARAHAEFELARSVGAVDIGAWQAEMRRVVAQARQAAVPVETVEKLMRAVNEAAPGLSAARMESVLSIAERPVVAAALAVALGESALRFRRQREAHEARDPDG